MGRFDKEALMHTQPYPGEINEAKNNPNGWIYRIAGNFLPHEDIPPEAVIGAWKVNENGQIVGDFEKNPNYDSNKYPT